MWAVAGVNWDAFWVARDAVTHHQIPVADRTKMLDLLEEVAPAKLLAEARTRERGNLASDERYKAAVADAGAPALGWTDKWIEELQAERQHLDSQIDTYSQCQRSDSPPAHQGARGRHRD